MQALVRLVIEFLAVERQGSDVIHDLAAEIVFASFGDIDSFFDRPHQAFIRLFVLTGKLVSHFFTLRIGFYVVDVVRTQSHQRLFVSGNRSLHFVLDDIGVLVLHD